MILAFQPRFVPKILARTKIHTIRKDPHQRWKPGREIQMATGIRTTKYKEFATSVCSSVQEIVIEPKTHIVYLMIGREFHAIDKELFPDFAMNDGFDKPRDFWEFFTDRLEGYLITWETLTPTV